MTFNPHGLTGYIIPMQRLKRKPSGRSSASLMRDKLRFDRLTSILLIVAAVLGTGERVSALDLDPPTVVIHAHKMKNPQTLEPFSRSNLGRITDSLVDAQELASGEIRLDGVPEKLVKMRYKRLNSAFESVYIVVVKGHVGYSMDFKTTAERFPEYQKEFDSIYKTIRFLK